MKIKLMLLAGAWAMDPLRRPAPRWLAGLGWVALVLVAAGLAVAPSVVFWLSDRRVDPFALLAIPAAAVLVWRLFAAPPRTAPVVVTALAWLAPALLMLVRFADGGASRYRRTAK